MIYSFVVGFFPIRENMKYFWGGCLTSGSQDTKIIIFNIIIIFRIQGILCRFDLSALAKTAKNW
jgi:hypothetical protein